ncbi:MAG: ABC transporter ATP-binding protein [Candidatus Eisenbacteria bacterium]|nr:ABC transporter ATP-binding protein [Candidatus Eisenbacteria bacterium]
MSEPVVRVEGLAVRYGAHRAVENLNFEVPEGASVSIIGPNGGGKSTVLKAILGLVPIETGSIRVFGQEPRRVSPARIGYMPQLKTMDRRFPALSVELVVSGLRRRWPARIARRDREKAMAALADVDAAHLADRPIRDLSGGEMQRIYIARCLVSRPRLVLLDEPASGIDAVGEADLYRLLEDYQRENGATMLVVTHDWQVAYHHSTHVLLLDRRQIGFGPARDCLTEDCLRAAFGHTGHSHEAPYLGGVFDV